MTDSSEAVSLMRPSRFPVVTWLAPGPPSLRPPSRARGRAAHSLNLAREAWGPLVSAQAAVGLGCWTCFPNATALVFQVLCGRHDVVSITARGGEGARRGQVRGWRGRQATSGAQGRTFVTVVRERGPSSVVPGASSSCACFTHLGPGRGRPVLSQ